MSKKLSPGFILPLTVIIIFSISALLIRLMTRATVLIPRQQMAADREQAKQLALMGVTLVQGQLALPIKKEKEKQEFFTQLLMLLNRWQSYALKEEFDGVDGSIEFYVSCEDGKIPLNALWKFKEKKFIAPPELDAKKLLANVMFVGNAAQKGQQPVLEKLAEFFKQRDKPLEDLTDLFSDDSFKSLATTWLPLPKNKEEGALQERGIYFGDFFTVALQDLKIQPLFFSASVKDMLNIKKESGDAAKFEEEIKKIAGNIKESVNWEQQWNTILAPTYGVTYEKLSEDIKKMFEPRVGASTISVVSYGKVGNFTQKVFALLTQNVDADGYASYAIRKLYWL